MAITWRESIYNRAKADVFGQQMAPAVDALEQLRQETERQAREQERQVAQAAENSALAAASIPDLDSILTSLGLKPQPSPVQSQPAAPTTPPAAPSGTPAAMPTAPRPTLPSTGEEIGDIEITNGGPRPAQNGDLRAYTRQKAAQLGIDPDIAERVAGEGEGGFDDPVRQSDIVYQGEREQSYGPFQMNVTGGLGTAMMAERGRDPRNPEHVYDAIDYALEHAARNGWGAFHGAARIGIGQWDGIGQASGGQVAPASSGTVQQARPAPMPASAEGDTPSSGEAFAAGSWTPNQFNAAKAEGLDDETAWAVCGPAAAIAFARRNGRNPTMQEALGIAKRVGWTVENGMAGPASQQRLLQEMGIAARLVDGAPDWQAVAADVQRGNPVTISTPGHYFVAERYDPETGMFDFGNSAAILKAAQGRRWFKPEELPSLGMGEARGSLFLDSPSSPAPSAVAGRNDTMQRMSLAGNPQPMPERASEQAAVDLATDISNNVPPRPQPQRTEVPYDPATGQTGAVPNTPAWQMPDRDVLPHENPDAWAGGGPAPTRTQPADMQMLRGPLGQQPELPETPYSAYDDGYSAGAPPAPAPQPAAYSAYDDGYAPTTLPTTSQTTRNYPTDYPTDYPELPGDTPSSGEQMAGTVEMAPREPAPVQYGPSLAETTAPAVVQRANEQPADRYLDTSLPSPPGWQAIVDGAGNVVDWVRERAQEVSEAAAPVVQTASNYVKYGRGEDAPQPAPMYPGEPEANLPLTYFQEADRRAAERSGQSLGERLAADVGRVVEGLPIGPMNARREEINRSFEQSQNQASAAARPVTGAIESAVSGVETALGTPPGTIRQAAEDVSGVLGPATAAVGMVQRASQSANPNIRNIARQMRGQYRPTGVDERPLSERIVAALTDRNAIAGNVERETRARVAAAGGTAPVTRLAERVRENPNSIAAQRAREELAPALQKVGDDADWLEQMLVHRHNLDVARAKGQEAYDEAIANGRTPQQAQRIADRVRQSRMFSGGMTEKDITQALSDMAAEIGPARFRAVVDAAQAFWAAGRKSLDEKLAEGMISPAVHQELTTRYPHYVRTDIADYFERGPAGPTPGGKTMGVSNVGIKSIDRAGTSKDRVNPVLSTIDALYAHEASMTRNAAAKDLAALRDADPTARALFKEVAPDVKSYRSNQAEMVPPDYTLRGNEQKLTVWENGKPRQFVVPGEYAQLLTPKQGALLGDSALAQFVRNFFGLWKAVITTHNPGFQFVVSPLRDLGDYTVGEAAKSATSGGLRGAGQALAAIPGVVADYARALPAAFEGLGQGRFGREVSDLRRAGAGFDGRPASTDRGLREAYRDLQNTGGMAIRSPQDAAKAARTILTLGAEPIGSRFELVPRIAAARRAARRGADELGQAVASKDATIDFLRGGWLVQQLNVPIPFLNPTVQSAAQVARLAKKNPAAFTAAVVAGVGVPAMLADAWNRSDEQRARAYQNVPGSVKNGGIVWMLPGVEGSTELGEGKPNYLWIPLGSFAFAARLAREGLGLADPITGLAPSPDKPGREVNGPADAAMRAAELGAEIMGMFSPVKGENLSSAVASLVPPVASEAIEIGIDKDLYRGNQIATDRRDENASRLSQGAAAAANYVGNTDQVRPSQVEHVVRGVGGYAGTLATAASDVGRDRGVSRPIQDIPIVGGLVSRVIRDTGGQRLEDARSTPARVPEGIRSVLAEAGLRTDEVTAVGSRYKGAQLTFEEQESWQDRTNNLIEREVAAARRSPEWRARDADKEKIVSEAVSRAKELAAERTLRHLTPREIDRRIRAEEARKAR